jgi:hypothetical protein
MLQDHALHITLGSVYRGLTGFYVSGPMVVRSCQAAGAHRASTCTACPEARHTRRLFLACYPSTADSEEKAHHSCTHKHVPACCPAVLQLMSDKLKHGGCGAPYNLEVGAARGLSAL